MSGKLCSLLLAIPQIPHMSLTQRFVLTQILGCQLIRLRGNHPMTA
jgi:hypothetical protein